MDQINQRIDNYIKGLIQGILAHPSLQQLTPNEKEEYAKKLDNHFSNLILEAAFNRMNSEQIADIKNNLQNPQEVEKKLEEYSAQIPGLAEDIEARLEKEVDIMKKTLSTVQSNTPPSLN